ncbi:hypothetical protein VPH35_027473 [Triticum aestivum]
MMVDWEQQWMSFPINGRSVTLQGAVHVEFPYTTIELSVITDENAPELLPEIQELVEKFKDVFVVPIELPPERACDHSIPLIPGARPFSLCPNRLAPELKDEVEKQIQELLDLGVIRRSNSPFSSPILLVKNKDHTWRLVVDYRHLNALTIKGKFLMPMIDELLDELHGAQWFTKLDLRVGYHQIRLAPGEEYKTKFQTHHGHFEFLVMGFGLISAPNTFQGGMYCSLSQEPEVLRHFVLVFFDDILVFSKTLEQHLQHVKRVLDVYYTTCSCRLVLGLQAQSFVG